MGWDGSVILDFIGRIWEYKGLDLLIKAEPQISREIRNLKIVIAGFGEDFSKYERLIVNRQNFEIINRHIEISEMDALFRSSALIVCPYKDGTQSSLPPLASQFGKPIIVTNVGSISEFVDDGIDGLVIPPNDVQALADSIITLLNNPSLRKSMGKKALEKSSGKFSYDSIAKETIECYRKAIGMVVK